MKTPEIIATIAVVISFLALGASIVALVRSWGLPAMQKQLARHDLLLLRKANVILSIRDRYRLIVTNNGRVEALNVSFEYQSTTHRPATDLIGPEQHIDILAPGVEIEWSFGSLGINDSLDMMFTWRWENPDGTIEERRSTLVIPYTRSARS